MTAPVGNPFGALFGAPAPSQATGSSPFAAAGSGQQKISGFGASPFQQTAMTSTPSYPFGGNSSTSSPFGAPPSGQQQSSPFGASAQPTAAKSGKAFSKLKPSLKNTNGNARKPSPSGSQPQTNGAQGVFGASAQSSPFDKKSQSPAPTATGFGGQGGQPKNAQAVNPFGAKRPSTKQQPNGQGTDLAKKFQAGQKKKNERPEKGQARVKKTEHKAGDNSGPSREPTERTKQLSEFAFGFANKLYDQLRKEKISPPQWVPEPGNPSKRSAVDALKEQYKKFRGRVYDSLRKADLIDDPEKRRKLEDALPFKGICEEMCPEFEQIARIAEYDVKTEEKETRPDGVSQWPEPSRMVKKFGRSAAGQDAPLPMDVRSVDALRRTTDYLFNELLQSDDNLPSMHNFLWDRTRAIRKDFTFHSQKSYEEMRDLVYCFETITRFHATALHLLSRKGYANDDFDQKQEIEQLGRTILSLMEAYDACREKQIPCENEPEFRAYYLLLNAHDPSIAKRIPGWGKEFWFDSEEVQTAMSLVQSMEDVRDPKGPIRPRRMQAIADTAFTNYFAIVEDPRVSYTMACIAEVHFTSVRQCILKTLVRAYARYRDAPRTITASDLNKLLRFDTDEEAVEFVELHGFEFSTWVPEGKEPVSKPYLLLNDRKKHVPSPRVKHSYSGKLVERKRNAGQSLPFVIYNTIFEETPEDEAQPQQGSGAGSPQDSLFVAQPTQVQGKLSPAPLPTSTTAAALLTTNAATVNPFAQNPFSAKPADDGSAPKTPVFSLSNPSTTPSGQPTDPKPASAFSMLGQATQQPPPVANPFAVSTPTTATNAPKTVRFSSTTTEFLLGSTGASSTSVPAVSTTEAPKPTAPANPFSFLSNSVPAQAQTPSVLQNAPKTTLLPPIASTAGSPATTQNKTDVPQLLPQSTTPQGLPAPSASLPSAGASQQAPAAGALTAVQGEVPKVPSILSNPSSLATVNPIQGAKQPPSTSIFERLTNPPTRATANSSPPGAKQPSSSMFSKAPPLPSWGSSGSTSLPAPASSSSGGILQPSQSQQPPPKPQPPVKKDLMAGLTKWYVLGDGGMMDSFLQTTIHDLLAEAWETFQKDEAERIRKEEDEKSWKEAREFQVYNLRVKYFYRWQQIARNLATKRILREGKEKQRRYQQEQRVLEKRRKAEAEKAQREARKEEKRRIEADGNRLSIIAATERQSRAKTEEQLLASGVFGGLHDERAVARRVVKEAGRRSIGHHYPESASDAGSPQNSPPRLGLMLPPAINGSSRGPVRPSSRQSSQSSIVTSNTERREGGKTRLLREKLGLGESRGRSASLGSSVNGGTPKFRQSLPAGRTTNFSQPTGSFSQSTAGHFSRSTNFSRSMNFSSRKRSADEYSSDGEVGGLFDEERERAGKKNKTVEAPYKFKTRHFELRARGLVPMPDGHWLPEAIARPIIQEGKRFDGIGDYGLGPGTENVPDPTADDEENGEEDTSPSRTQLRLARLRAPIKIHDRGHHSVDFITSSRTSYSPTGSSKRKRGSEEEQEGVDGDIIGPPEGKRANAREDTQAMVEDTKKMLRELREMMDELDKEETPFMREQILRNQGEV